MSDLPPGFVEDAAPPPGFVLDPHPTAPAAPEEAPGAISTFFRKASNAVSSNLVNPISAGITHAISGQPYQDALRGINETDAAGSAAHPIASAVGTVAGAGLQMAAPIPLPKGLSPAATGAITGAGFGALGGAGDALNAGGGATDALSAAGKGALGGAAVGGVVGGVVGKLVRGSPERVEDRIISNIARGEAGGAAGKKATTGLMKRAAAGEVMPELEATGLTGTVATQAAAKPAKVADKVTGVIDKYTTERIDPVYAAIDKAGGSPKGFDLKYQILQLHDKLKGEGKLQEAEFVDRYAKHLEKGFADDQKLTGDVIRNARSEVGKGNTFTTDEANLTPAIAAKQAIYGAYNATIEAAAARVPGVNVAELKAANKTVSTLLSVRDALTERATKAAKGGTGLGTAITGAVMRAGEGLALAPHAYHALMAGDLPALAAIAAEAAAAEVGNRVVMKAIPQAVRRADYGLSRLELGARAGDITSRAGRAIIEGGTARVIAPKVGRAAGSFLSPGRDDANGQ